MQYDDIINKPNNNITSLSHKSGTQLYKSGYSYYISLYGLIIIVDPPFLAVGSIVA